MTPHVVISEVASREIGPAFEDVAGRAFASGGDAELDEWFSFDVMRQALGEGAGLCVAARIEHTLVGFVYAQPESPINGREGLEKWVLVIAAVDPAQSGSGVGSALVAALEQKIVERGGTKLFIYTNQGDDRVIRFYQRCGYEDAGWVRDYQYGMGNSAVFLLKHLPARL